MFVSKRLVNFYDFNSKSTWTKEDKMEKIVVKKLSKGPDPSNYKGPAKRKKYVAIKMSIIVDIFIWF